MGVQIHKGTLEGGVTPICNRCGISLCWDISNNEYEEIKDWWDAWMCADCNGGVPLQMPKKDVPRPERKDRPLLVTIIADASHDHHSKAAGYGFWIASKRGKHAGQGAFKTPIRDSVLAETYAIINATHVAIKRELVLPGDMLLIQSDCTGAIYLLSGDTKPDREDLIEARAFFQNLSKRQGSVIFKHVKGHTREQDARSLSQRHADRRAKKGMREARANMAQPGQFSKDLLNEPWVIRQKEST